MQYCSCTFPKITSEHGEKSCLECGHWLNPDAAIVIIDENGKETVVPNGDISKEEIDRRILELDGPKQVPEFTQAQYDASAMSLQQKDALMQRVQAANRYEMATTPRNQLPGRNDPCPCGSGKRFKKCCIQ